jgi:hypothetical protein
MMLILFLGVGAVSSLLLSGYLYGAKSAQRARAAIILAHDAKAAQVRSLESELAAVRQQGVPVEPPNEDGVTELRRELRHVLQRESEANGLREMMRELAGPMLERQRLGKELSGLDAGSGLAELPRLLDSIASKCSLDAVILSDDVGLPLAASSKASDIESFAGFSALLLTVADRVGVVAPAPVGIVMKDAASRHVLYRIFRVGSARYMLIAVAHGAFLSPEALDPALGALEKVLTKATDDDWS